MLNRVTLIGRLTADPTIRSTNDGREVANFTLATSEKWKGKDGERKEKSEFHKIACFNPALVDVIRNYVKKGSLLYITGALQTRKWTDKDGQEKYATEIVMQGYGCQLILLSEKQKDEVDHQAPISEARSDGKTGFANDYMNDDIPF